MMASIVAWEYERRPSTTRRADQRAAVSTSKMRSSQMKAVEVPKAGRKITPSVTISDGLRKAGEKKVAASGVWGSCEGEVMAGPPGGRGGEGGGSASHYPGGGPPPGGRPGGVAPPRGWGAGGATTGGPPYAGVR